MYNVRSVYNWTLHILYTQQFKGNWDADTIASNFLSPTIVSRFVRLYPLEHVNHCALRVEFIGCYSGDEGKQLIIL